MPHDSRSCRRGNLREIPASLQSWSTKGFDHCEVGNVHVFRRLNDEISHSLSWSMQSTTATR
jgi:hypothetical protein